MLNKKIMILAIFLVGLLVVSSVSAADNAASDIAGVDDSADQVDSAIKEENFDSSNASEGDDFESYSPMALDDECGKLGMSNDGEILGSEIHVRGDEFARIHVAIHQANDGDIIYLDSVTYTSTGSPIIISKSITLVSQVGTVLDAQGKSGIFVVQADNVVIKNIKFINAKYEKGSAIDIGGDSNFSLSNCTFINNTAWAGGAIYWPAADGSITNCTFIGNSADYGGAMYTGGDGGEISNCVFINNNANYGKALDAQSYSKIYDSYFKNIPFLDITDKDSSLTLTLMANLDYSGTVFTSITKKENLKYWNGSAYVNGDDPNFGTLKCPDKNVTLELYHSNGELAYSVSNFTDANGQIVFDYSKFNDDRYVYRAYAFDDDSNFISATGRLNDNIGDFTLLQNYINNVGENGTVNLTRDYTFTDGLDDNLKKGIIIPFNLTICGNGYTINGAKSARIFNVTGNNVAIYGINFINGYSSDDGGAIYVNGGCTLINCTFTNNAVNRYGGAVYWNTNAVGITNCTFEDNIAEYGFGGANYFEAAVTNVALTGNFNNNTAEYFGGANCFNKAVTNVNLTGNFTNNHAETKNGGANCFNNEVNNVALTGNFNDNTAQYGGANYFWAAVTNVTLTGNFTNNRAEIFGGVNNFNDEVINVTLTGNFTNNFAGIDGGVNHFAGAVTNVALTGNFINNRAETGIGGANYFYLTVTNVNLTGNFTNNTAKYYGGANFFLNTVDNVTLIGNFNNNTAYSSGGANYFNGAVDNIALTGNFTNNRAETGSGGANFFNDEVTNVALTGNFTNNRAAGHSGANYFNGAVTNVTLTGNFNNNSAGIFGGVNNFNDEVINVTLTGNFINNSAGIDGGVNNFAGAVTNVALTGNFINNRAETGSGGANYFYLTVTNVNLTGNFTNNSAINNGGANYFWDDVTNVNLTGNFTNNRAETGYGGANCFYDEVTNITLSGNFINNTAGDGSGGVNNFDDRVTNISLSGNFTDNFAGIDGGANCFYWDVTNGYFSGNFINNRAGRDGGANEFSHHIVDVTLSGNFINNTAGRNGGANEFYWDVTNVNLTGVFINNTAKNGSAHYFDYDLTNVIIAGNFINNNNESSVIYIANSVSGNVIRDSIFLNNGPINVTEGSVDAFDNWFGNNVTDYDVAPDVGIDLDNWLFINGTADPNPVLIADTSNIVFILSRYDGNNVSSYDNSRLLPIKLDITSTLGSVNPNPVNLNESITYTPERGGTGSVTASFENVQCTIEINNKINPGLSMDPQEITYSNNTVIALNFNDSATGTVNITLKGNKYNKTYENLVLNATILLEGDILPDEYDVIVTYSGDEIFSNASCNSKLKVVSIATVIIVDKEFDILATDYNAGERGHLIYATLADEKGNPLFNKTIQIAINGVIYYVNTNEDGLAGIQINLASANTYTCAWFFQGDEAYNASLLASSKIVISKKPITISASNCVFKASAKIKTVTAKISTAPNPYDGKTYLAKNKLVTLTLNGRIYNARTDENGEVKFNIQVTKKGTYNAVIRFAGDRTYNGASKTIKITLDDKGASTSQKSGAKTEVLASSTDANVIPTSNFVPTKNTTVIDVAKEFTRVATDYNAGERGDYFYAILKDADGNVLANKTVQIALNGPIYYVTTDENGAAKLMVNLASANTYTYALAFSGDKDYNAAPLTCSKLIVTKKPIAITAKDQTFKAAAKTKTVTATLSTSKNPYDGKTYLSPKKVTLKVDGKTYTGTCDGAGKVSFNVQLTKKGTYSAVISFDGDKTYGSATKTIKITVS